MGDSCGFESKLNVKVDTEAGRTVLDLVRTSSAMPNLKKAQVSGKGQVLEIYKTFSINWKINGEKGFLFPLVAIFLLAGFQLSLYLQMRALDGRNRELEKKLEIFSGRLEDCVLASDLAGLEMNSAVAVGEDEHSDVEDIVGIMRDKRETVRVPSEGKFRDAEVGTRLRRGLGKGRKGSRGNVKLWRRLRALRRRLLRREKFALELQSRLQDASDARAVYLMPTTDTIDVTKKDGEWISKGLYRGGCHVSRISIGFADETLWYKNIRLANSSTSIVFQEDGLFLISAQVYFYKDMPSTKANLMGFRIYLRKSPKKWPHIVRPIPLAECIPAQPVIEVQTCFTQVAWFLDEGDEIYLSNFMDGLPLIQNDSQGQTFLGIVKL